MGVYYLMGFVSRGGGAILIQHKIFDFRRNSRGFVESLMFNGSHKNPSFKSPLFCVCVLHGY